MNVAIVGPGRVGTVLAQALPRAGHRVVAVTGGSAAARERLQGRVAGVRITDLDEAVERADLVVLATPDEAIGPIARDLAARDVVGPRNRVVHLAGSLGLDVLAVVARTGAGIAAIHPAQTVPEDAAAETLVGAAWGVTASLDDLPWARQLVVDLGGDPHEVRDGDRTIYHASLVLGSNAVAAAMSAARQLLLAVGVERPEAFLAGLGSASQANVLASGAQAITGPVVRGDVATLERHLAALDADLPEIAAAYRHLQRAVLAQVSGTLSADARHRLAEVLGD